MAPETHRDGGTNPTRPITLQMTNSRCRHQGFPKNAPLKAALDSHVS
jgi:hypothetical protein